MEDALKNLKIAMQLVGDAKIVVDHHVQTATILCDEELLAGLKVSALKIGSDIGIIENALNHFERIGMRSKRYAVNKS